MLYAIIIAGLVIAIAAFAAWFLLARRAAPRPIGFRDYVRDPSLRQTVSQRLNAQDQLVHKLATLPPDALVTELLDDECHDIVRKAVALNPACAQPLINALGDPRFRRASKPNPRHGMLQRSQPLDTVLMCLYDLRPASAAAPLASLVNDPTDSIRKHAAWALGAIGTQQALEPLKVSFRDQDEYVCSYAMSGVRRALDAGATTPQFRAAAFDLVQTALYRPEYTVSRAAPECLLLLDRERAIHVLTDPKSLSLDQPGVEYRLRALREAQVAIDESTLLRLIARAERHVDTATSASLLGELLRSLASTSPQTAATVVERFLDAPSKDVAEAAAEAFAIARGISDPFGFGFDQLDKHDWEGLPHSIRLALAVRILIDEVNNGGLSQYFVNSSGQRWRDALNGLEAIGAASDLAMFKAAIARFGKIPPDQDDDKRHHQLAAIENADDGAFSAFDDAFYKDPDAREVLLMRFIVKHAADFQPAS